VVPLGKQPDDPKTRKGKGHSKFPNASEESATENHDFVNPSLDYSPDTPRRRRKSPSGNPLLTVVNATGICDMEILPCICDNRPPRHEQLLQAGLFPSSFEEPETAFTFMVLDDYLIENLECKTTGQQYYSKLQSLTNRMFPHHVPVCIIAFHICAYAHTYHRICTDSFSGQLVNGEISQLGCKVGLATSLRIASLRMGPWPFSARLAPSQESIFLKTGRPDIATRSMFLMQIVLLCSSSSYWHSEISSYAHSLWMATFLQNT